MRGQMVIKLIGVTIPQYMSSHYAGGCKLTPRWQWYLNETEKTNRTKPKIHQEGRTKLVTWWWAHWKDLCVIYRKGIHLHKYLWFYFFDFHNLHIAVACHVENDWSNILYKGDHYWTSNIRKCGWKRWKAVLSVKLPLYTVQSYWLKE